MTSLPRQARCGRNVVSTLGLIEVVKAGPIAHFRGLGLCGLIWTCPVCSAKIRQGRAVDIGDMLGAALRREWGVEFLTLTLRHHAGQRLAVLLEGSAGAWNSTLKARPLRRMLDQLGYVGLVQVHEVTYGQHGWHPHRHAALIFRRALTDQERADLEAEIMKTWGGRLKRRGLSALNGVGALLRRCTASEGLAWYLTKVDRADGQGESALGVEMLRGDLKTGKGLRPDQLLAALVETGESKYLRLWQEYEAATSGRQLMTITDGLRRELLGRRPEKSDDELAAEAPTEGEVLADLDVAAWREVRAASPGGVALLEAAEEGREAVVRYLTDTVQHGRWWVGKDGWLEAS